MFLLLQHLMVLLPPKSHRSSLINSCSTIWSVASAGTCAVQFAHWRTSRKQSYPFLERSPDMGKHLWNSQIFCQVSVSLEHNKRPDPTHKVLLSPGCCDPSYQTANSPTDGDIFISKVRPKDTKKMTIRWRRNSLSGVSHLIARCVAVGVTDGFRCSDCICILVWSTHHKTKETSEPSFYKPFTAVDFWVLSVFRADRQLSSCCDWQLGLQTAGEPSRETTEDPANCSSEAH